MPYVMRSGHPHTVVTASPAYPQRVTWAEIEQRIQRSEARLWRSTLILDTASVLLTVSERRIDRPCQRPTTSDR
jgi:hypothetical protein